MPVVTGVKTHFLGESVFPPPPNAAPHPLFGHAFRTRGLHILVPTPDVRLDSCRLLLSAAAAGYPDPVLIGWGGRGLYNGSESNLFRISETLAYLRTLKKSASDDLVVLADPQAVVFQLPPEVLIRRYFRTIRRKNEKLKKDRIYRRRGSDGIPVMDSILNFEMAIGTSECWPQDPEKGMHCQYMPDSTLYHILNQGISAEPSTDPLADDIYGPAADGPRFLNSGAMIGPVKDLRRLLQAVINTIEAEFNEMFPYRTSDQHYIATVWARQEQERTHLAANNTKEVSTDDSYEYHVAVDHGSDLFMLSSWSQPYTVWMTFNHSVTGTSSATQRSKHDPTRLDRLTLGSDLTSLQNPFPNTPRNGSSRQQVTWADIILGTNTVTGKAFPAYHVTELTETLDARWPRMWFQPHGRALLRAQRARRVAATSKHAHAEAVVAEVRGTRYTTVHAHRGNRQQEFPCTRLAQCQWWSVE
ncbi:hypothetical protein EJ03DRAFT_360171 [Teratosphaeria nubilosa]|uniref:Uncharacterized protein n=1 Tax=Teratosphaeria nubilosa TaxID=161662 RepID=A0A6G1LE10_9PEZI|nr:hypothetical protein EJ03DRAFT_360171 [Teratosphaeria nubilosa]